MLIQSTGRSILCSSYAKTSMLSQWMGRISTSTNFGDISGILIKGRIKDKAVIPNKAYRLKKKNVSFRKNLQKGK